MFNISNIQDQISREAGSDKEGSPQILPFFIPGEEKRPCILICPGGAYKFTSPREAEPVARAYNAHGFHALVLHYRTAPHKHPAPLLDLSNTLSLLRRYAEELKILKNQIIVCGFSAGGHLAASLGVHWDQKYLKNSICIKKGLNRPDGIILSYPVISSGKFAHRGSFRNLLGKKPSADLMQEMSLEIQVSKKTPPCFLWHTAEDSAVPIENSLLFASALSRHKIPFELHTYPFGAHGLSLGTEKTDETKDGSMTIPHVQGWLDLSAAWVRMMHEKGKV